ncbi:MAG: hypothetical protein IE878_00720 [Epsilonproteobacteria bacterium]|nr:hypothetical protein [Campylobacterota bacterium]
MVLIGTMFLASMCLFATNNLTQAFEQDPRYKDYKAALKTNKSAEALEIQKQILNDITQATLGQFLSELSNRSRE